MSHSYKHTPIFGNGGDSEKRDKKILHGKIRAIRRIKIHNLIATNFEEEYIEPKYDEVFNKWSMSKDGKSYWLPKSGTRFGFYVSREEVEEDLKRSMRK